jgi:predicted RNA-binding protein with PUA-like domain
MIHTCVLQGVANHYQSFSRGEWVIDGMAVLSASDYYDKFVNALQNRFYCVQVPQMKRLESSNVKPTSTHEPSRLSG